MMKNDRKFGKNMTENETCYSKGTCLLCGIEGLCAGDCPEKETIHKFMKHKSEINTFLTDKNKQESENTLDLGRTKCQMESNKCLFWKSLFLKM